MKRTDVEHVVRAAGRIANEKKVLIIGSNAIYGSIPVNECNFYKSNEVDIVFFKDNERLSNEIDGAIGEMSQFHMQHQYYAHGVSVDTATLPRGWRNRLNVLSSELMGHIKAYCISAEDLAASKLVAGRDKDFKFVVGLFESNITTPEKVEELIHKLPRKTKTALRNLEICKQQYLARKQDMGMSF
jgi:hypothetical protein